MTAIKYTFIDQAQHYDELLNPIIVEFLSLIKDEDLVCDCRVLFHRCLHYIGHWLTQFQLQNVRRLSLSTLNSAAHNKPYLIRNVLNTLLPLLYQETMVKVCTLEITFNNLHIELTSIFTHHSERAHSFGGDGSV